MLRIEIRTDNAAFNAYYTDEENMTYWEKAYYRNEEVKRILKNVCNQMDNGKTSGYCIDINGNRCGEWSID